MRILNPLIPMGMPGDLPALNKPLCYGGGLFAGLLILGGVAAAQDWYVSNAAGMALEPAFSRFALRNEYALSVDARSLADIPEPLRAYYTGPYHIELRTLYEKGEESKRQWIFRDDRRVDRLAAAFNEDGSGFIELYDAGGFLSEEHRIDAGGDEYIVTYHYNRDLLVRAETRLKAPPRAAETEAESPAETAAEPGGAGEAGTETAAEPEDAGEAGTETAAAPDPPGETEAETVVTELWTDYYRYSRSYSLRAVDRVFHQDVPAVRTRFPHQVLAAASAEDDFVRPGSAHGSGFLGDVLMKSGDRIVYTTDERGRVLRE
ncbi:MAG: hypothetical protein LBP32_03280, partial [Spirochaetaceae bacterium]|nr:hypothetical protein [Spirochaetaceae bacterium]